MKKLLSIVLAVNVVALAAALFVFRGGEKAEEKEFFNIPRNREKEVLEKLSLDQKIGQMFIIGFKEKKAAPELEALIKELHPGGILLLSRNIESEEQLKELTGFLQKIAMEDSGLPLFIAVDQEGGPISRINWMEDAPQSEINTKEQACLIGRRRGEQLKELGVNLNLAPLLDISYPGDFIFDRTFKASADLIKELGAGLIQGQKEAGIMTAIKHFPGYGGISFNPEEKLAFAEGLPGFVHFQETAKAGADMIMISNVVYKVLSEELPFSFLPAGIDLLNTDDYLIISDDLSQNSLLNNFSLKEIVSSPVKAGVNILIFSGWRSPVHEGVWELQKAVEQGEVEEETINNSVLKIIKLKQEYFNLF